jgi:predicted transcriptional regulator
MRGSQGPDGDGHSGDSRTVEGDEASELLVALADEDCRTLLQAANGEALSASELSERCGLPLSTTYRKVATLTEAGLFEEQVRLCSSGKHTSEYLRSIDDITLSLTGGCIDIEISERASTDLPGVSSVPAGAD